MVTRSARKGARTPSAPATGPQASIEAGRTSLGIELGSTRIKACLVDDDGRVLAVGGHVWESHLDGGLWSYHLDQVWAGLQAAYRTLADNVADRYGLHPVRFGSIGVSAMMHGYLAFDSAGELLVPFRTWRNMNTGRAAAELTELFKVNIPLRWSVAHFFQAVLDREDHVERVAELTTLAGYVHRCLTGRRVLGIGDASGMFPVDSATLDYDESKIAAFERRLGEHGVALRARSLLPEVLVAGADAGALTEAGAALLDARGDLRPGVPFCPPEGDAGTGMAATGAVAPRTGNTSVGTSIFAMAVLERPLQQLHTEIDSVTTPAGAPVAMVHCNNGALEIEEWAQVFADFASAAGVTVETDDLYRALFAAALSGAPDAGGLTAYNYLSGEPITGLPSGRPLLVRPAASGFGLADLMRAQIYGVFATLRIGMDVLADEGLLLDQMRAHGGMFRTAGPAQRLLAAALEVPVTVSETASEGGAWGMALLAAYLRIGAGRDLEAFIRDLVVTPANTTTVEPQADDVTGYRAFLARYRAGLDVVRLATQVV